MKRGWPTHPQNLRQQQKCEIVRRLDRCRAYYALKVPPHEGAADKDPSNHQLFFGKLNGQGVVTEVDGAPSHLVPKTVLHSVLLTLFFCSPIWT